MRDPLVEAIDDLKRGRDGNLPTILAAMIKRGHVLTADEIIEIRGAVYVDLVKMLRQTDVPSIDQAKLLHKVVHDRRVDHYRKRKRKADPDREVSIEALPHWREPAANVDVEQLVIDAETISEVQSLLAELRASENEVDQRSYLILEAFASGDWIPVRISEIMGKQISKTNASTLLLRAKQRLRDRLAASRKEVKS